jgi:glycolate oxidase FAD binding subunit
VVRPGTTEEVAAVLAWATREGIGVLPVASGSRVVPVSAEGAYVVLSTTRLSGIEIYEPADLTFTARAGTPFRVVADALGPEGQWVPFDPPRVTERSIGGLVGSGESGSLWMGYGELRNHVLGATVVTGDGRTLRLGGRVVKNVAGYDLLKAVVGSRGTLAVMTSVCVRASPRPAVDRVLVLRGLSLTALLDAAMDVGTAPMLPVSSVLADRIDDGADRRAAALVVRLHGARTTVEADQASLERHIGAAFDIIGDDGFGPEASHAHTILNTIRDRGATDAVVLDVSARPSRLREVLSALAPLDAHALVADTYGGRIRVGLRELDHARVHAARQAIEGLGGALRVRRGVGGQADEVHGSGPSDDEMGLTHRLRGIFDPAGVFWPAR